MGKASWHLRPSKGTGLNPPTSLSGHEEGNFVINADSGNLTMTRSVPSPKTFVFLVKVGLLARPPQAIPEPQAAGLTLQGSSGHCCFPLPPGRAGRPRQILGDEGHSGGPKCLGEPTPFPIEPVPRHSGSGLRCGRGCQGRSCPLPASEDPSPGPRVPGRPCLGLPGFSSGVGSGVLGAWLSPGLCPGPQLSDHI